MSKTSGPTPGAASLPEPDVVVSFASLVVSLATAAMEQLGQGEGTAADLAVARHSIDALVVLKEKTAGNLDEEEAHLLDSLLRDLRIRYLEAHGRRGSPGGAGA